MLCFLRLDAQIMRPARLSFASSQSLVQPGDTIQIAVMAEVDEGWYMYSSDFSEDLGPSPTVFSFEEDSSYELLGGPYPIGSKRRYEEIWDGEYTYFVGRAEFRFILLIKELPLIFSGHCDYQVCSEDDGRCIQLSEDFGFSNFLENHIDILPLPLGNSGSDVLDPSDPVVSEGSDLSLLFPYLDLWKFFLLAFLGGIAALLTPCVFPLIPMTVSYFTSSKSRDIRHPIWYGLSIVFIYLVIGMCLSLFVGPTAANALATHWLPNLLFFAVFFLFGLSFLGMFDLRLPSRWVDFTDRHANKGSLTGIFFMALTLVLATFSCTGPIVGSILVESAGGLFLKPLVGMLGYSLAFALPFSFLAAFPNSLSLLPKSGGWMNTVKVVLGFLELGLALKFLSVADQAYHWGILDREICIVLWISLFLGLTLFLWGKISLNGSSSGS
ncbi:MAG: protein-disulfide reductase DsbD family protein, partial [Cytophagales bacterium]|nr:protein-disulfide reductase DsbD family protein [Cytophagales bacterium]